MFQDEIGMNIKVCVTMYVNIDRTLEVFPTFDTKRELYQERSMTLIVILNIKRKYGSTRKFQYKVIFRCSNQLIQTFALFQNDI